MFCERWERRLHDISEEERTECRACGMDCFSCGCLYYDLDDQDFEATEDWLPDDPDPLGDDRNALNAAGVSAKEAERALEEIARAFGELAEAAATAIRALIDALQPAVEAIMEQIEKITEALEADNLETLDRRKGWRRSTKMTIIVWLLPPRSVQELYGQVVDYGPLAHPVCGWTDTPTMAYGGPKRDNRTKEDKEW